jgi:hypothetical protein
VQHLRDLGGALSRAGADLLTQALLDLIEASAEQLNQGYSHGRSSPCLVVRRRWKSSVASSKKSLYLGKAVLRT